MAHLHQDTWFVNDGNGKYHAAAGISGQKQQRDSSAKILPRSGTISSTVLQTSAQNEVLFDISGEFDGLDACFLRFDLTNAHATDAATLVPELLDEISVYVDGIEVQKQYGIADYALRRVAADNKREYALLTAMGISPSTYASTISVAAASASTTTVSIPLHTVLNSEIPFWRKAFSYRVGIKFRGGAGIMMSSSVATVTDVTMTNLHFICDGFILDHNVKSHLDQLLNVHPISFHYNNVQRDSTSMGASTAGTAYQANFKQQGHISSIYMVPKESTATNQTASYAPSQLLTSWEFLQSGSVKDHGLSDGEATGSLRKVLAAAKFPNTEVLTLLNQHWITFTEDVVAAATQGSAGGKFVSLGNSEAIRLTPSANFTSLILDTYANTASQIVLDFNNRKMVLNKNYV